MLFKILIHGTVNGKSNVKQKFFALKKRYFILVAKYGYNITENIQSTF